LSGFLRHHSIQRISSIGAAMYQVKDAMTRRVISIRPEATVEEAIRLLLKHNISGAPVIDESGALKGIITQYQLLEVLYEPTVKNSRVEECMTREVITIDEDSLLGPATNFFVLHRIRRIPVVKGGKVIGILSRQDLLRYFAETGEELEAFFAKLKRTPSDHELVLT
jgi:CBS domain-containing protein